MSNEIIYVCNSVNNKNIREGELEILEKHEEGLYFEFGENNMNIKKRFYNDIETLNKDFDALMKLKNREDLIEKTEKELNEKLTKEILEENVVAEIPVVENKKNVKKEIKEEQPKKNYRKHNKKSLF